MIDFASGGGYDGLTPTGRNANQGAESTLAALSTLQLFRDQAACSTVISDIALATQPLTQPIDASLDETTAGRQSLIGSSVAGETGETGETVVRHQALRITLTLPPQFTTRLAYQ